MKHFYLHIVAVDFDIIKWWWHHLTNNTIDLFIHMIIKTDHEALYALLQCINSIVWWVHM